MYSPSISTPKNRRKSDSGDADGAHFIHARFSALIQSAEFPTDGRQYLLATTTNRRSIGHPFIQRARGRTKNTRLCSATAAAATAAISTPATAEPVQDALFE